MSRFLGSKPGKADSPQDDFYHFSQSKSYAIALPEFRQEIYNHPYVLVKPSMYFDYHSFDEQRLG